MNNRSAQNLAQAIETEQYSVPRPAMNNTVNMQKKSFEKLMAQRHVYDELESRFGCVVAQWIFDRL